MLKAKAGFSQNILIACLVLALLLLAVLAVLLRSPQELGLETLPNRSIYNSKPSGLRAWYLAAQKSGLTIKVWEDSFEHIDKIPKLASLLVVEPFVASRGALLWSPHQNSAILQWVGQGNTLILLDPFKTPGPKALLKTFDLEVSYRIVQKRGEKPVEESLQISGNALLRSFIKQQPKGIVTSFFSLKPGSKAQVLLKTKYHQPVLLRLPYQKGAVILGTLPELVENAQLYDRPGNFQLLANLISLEKKPLFIDEFIHGYSSVHDIFSYLRKNTPVGAIFLQLSFVFLLVLWLSFVRWVPVIRPQEVVMHSGLRTLIDSLAGIYYRRHAVGPVIQPQISQINRTLQQRYQVEPADTSRLRNLLETLDAPYSSNEVEIKLETIQRANALLNPDHPEYEEVLSHRDILHLSRQLTEIQKDLQHVKR